MISIKFDTSSILAKLDQIDAAVAAAVRPAAQAGAQELYAEAKLRCPVLERGNGHYFYGTSFKKSGQKYWFAKGNLRNAIYQAYSKDNSGPKRASYHVAWNHQKAPYGFMVEYGTSRAAAHPFLRPAYDAVKNRALAAGNAIFVQHVQKALA